MHQQHLDRFAQAAVHQQARALLRHFRNLAPCCARASLAAFRTTERELPSNRRDPPMSLRWYLSPSDAGVAIRTTGFDAELTWAMRHVSCRLLINFGEIDP